MLNQKGNWRRKENQLGIQLSFFFFFSWILLTSICLSSVSHGLVQAALPSSSSSANPPARIHPSVDPALALVAATEMTEHLDSQPAVPLAGQIKDEQALSSGKIFMHLPPSATTTTTTITNIKGKEEEKEVEGKMEAKTAAGTETGPSSSSSSSMRQGTDNPTPPGSKFFSNGQFATSQVTQPTLIPVLGSFPDSSPISYPGAKQTSPSAAQGTTIATMTSIMLSERSFYPVRAPIVKIPTISKSDSRIMGPTPSSLPSARSFPAPQSLSVSSRNVGLFQRPSSAPTHASAPITSMGDNDDDEEIMKQSSSLNLLRKLWSSSRTTTARLNFTQQHESILRVEPLPNDSGWERVTGAEVATPKVCPDQCSSVTSSSPPSSSPMDGLPAETKTTPLEPLDRDKSNDNDKQVAEATDEEPPAAATIFRVGSDVVRNYEKHGTTTFVKTLKRRKKYRGIERLRNPISYPEWLSSGGVYPDDGSSSSNNFTADYYTDATEYESSGEGAGDGPGTASKIINPGEIEEERGGGEGEIMDEAYEQGPRQNILRKRINGNVLEKVLNSTAARLDSAQQKNNPYGESNPEEMPRENDQEIGALSSSSNGHRRYNNMEIGASFERNQGIGSLSTGASLPQPGLADVISRGRIDSVMYVYFGEKYNDYHKEEVAGRIIQAVGGVVAAIAQVLTVLGAAKCIRRVTNSASLPVHLHCGFALLLSNLLFLLAVHATEPADICATVAIVLHYLHLVIGSWLFAHTMKTYRALCRHVAAPNLLSSTNDAEQDSSRESFRTVRPSTVRYSIAAWTAPVPFLIMSYLINPDGYETRRYCWMSIEKGMVISFIVPIFLLIGLNTFLVVLSLRHLLALRKLWEDAGEVDEDYLDAKMISKGIRASAMLLPLLAIMWFLGVVALENSTSIFFQLAATLANIALSWLVMYFLGDDVWPEGWCPCSKLDGNRQDLSSLYEDPTGSTPSVQPSAQLSFDNEPLLASPAPVPSTSSNAVASTCTNSIMTGSGNGSYTKSKPRQGRSATSSVTTTTNATSIRASSLSSSSSSASPSSSSTTTTSSTTHALPRPHPSMSKWPKSNRPNWSQPGGNEIYELRQDAISTIYK